ncbi:MAG TPA: 16S rRNA (uracil(1498)-N(3))-methyltransferase [Bacillota bacterium]|nr:16S rRNA (uracil(1498)-N(3))-methyltransferase [Bacillota bacterium]
MQRYFVKQEQFDKPLAKVTINGEDVGHIVKVMRSSVGDRFITCDENGECYLSRIIELDKERVICTLEEKIEEDRELPVRVTIAQGLPKGDKMDLIIQKGTELGAHAFIPFSSSRTIVQLDEKKEQKRLERWGKIAKEAAEQSHRGFIPHIKRISSLRQIFASASQYDLALIAYENEKTTPLSQPLQKITAGARILLIIGPEGGFAEEEVKQAMCHRIEPVMLGRRILRTETAGLYGLSCISYDFEQLGGR